MLRPSCFLFFFATVVACGSETSIADVPAGSSENGSPAPGASSSTSAPEPKGGGANDTTCTSPAPSCAAARHLASTDEFFAETSKLPWQGVSISKTGALSIGGDLVADVDLDLDAASIPWTTSANDSTHTPLFRDYAFPKWSGPGSVAGVACAEKGDHPVRKGDTCARLTIAKGTTFRLRAVVEDMHPSGPTYWPFVEIERSCTTPCADDEVRCGASQTCFTKGFAACAYCEGGDQATCACRASCGNSPDGEKCYVERSPDQEEVGSCQSGTCQY